MCILIESLAGEDSVGDYTDIGDFDYMENTDIDAENMEDVMDSDLSPDSVGEDIGEITEEVGEMAEKIE